MTPQHVTRLFESTITRPEKFSFYRVNFKPISSRKLEQFTSRKITFLQVENLNNLQVDKCVFHRSKKLPILQVEKFILKLFTGRN